MTEIDEKNAAYKIMKITRTGPQRRLTLPEDFNIDDPDFEKLDGEAKVGKDKKAGIFFLRYKAPSRSDVKEAPV